MIEKKRCRILPRDAVIMAQPTIIKHYGRTCAMFLQQVHYWLQYERIGVNYGKFRWIYKTSNEWAAELCISERTVRRCVKKLRAESILLVEQLSPKLFDKTNYYTIDYDALADKIGFEFKIKKSTICPHRTDTFVPTNTLRTNTKSYKSKDSKKVGAEPELLESDVVLIEQPEGLKTDLLHVRDMFNAIVDKIASKKRYFLPKLDKKVACCLGALRKKFPTLEEWRKYLRLIASSAYLMSEKFILRLKWLLKFATIDRILAGDLGVKLDCLKEKPKDIDVAEVEALKHIEDVNETDQAKDIRKQILKSIDPREYNGWFVNIKIDPGLQFHYPNDFIKYFVTTRFACVLESVLGFNELKGENG